MKSVFEFLYWHTVESTAFAVIVIALVFVFRLHGAANRFALLEVALLKFLVPVGAFASLFVNVGALAPLSLEAHQIRFSDIARDFGQATSVDWFAAALLIWLFGTLCIGASRTVGLYRNRRLVALSRSGSRQVRERIGRALEQAGYGEGRQPDVFEDARIASIGLIGFFRPRIIVNAAFLETLTDTELLAAIKHELAHVHRRDNLRRLAHETAATLFWFHPLIWMLRQKLRAESEIACDEFALSHGEEPESYAKCLLKAASTRRPYNNVWVTSFSAATLKKRVRKIVTYENRNESKMKLLALYLLVVCSLGATLAAPQNLKAADTEEPIYSMQDLDKKPHAVVMAKPQYPQKLHESKTPGDVVVEFVLDTNGIPRNVRAIKSSQREFEQPSIDCVTDSTWAPGEISGEPVSVLVRIPIIFKP
ncbi:M56 family metallopeptidase [Pelagicoccus sp. SDUM812003]|uniref:M56 family metallopeptidase n=1 Tax=Pelagicoccus sp. SDUM812003 TaxID=3041267 RepID=UPI00280E8771|nr:M56 family metallopeptidase [Pelagicoccus sp. SDUM812003]MDQ8204279.1 M56 family metallopeptidase [Pelagicoccus sp. SDUM812003]